MRKNAKSFDRSSPLFFPALGSFHAGGGGLDFNSIFALVEKCAFLNNFHKLEILGIPSYSFLSFTSLTIPSSIYRAVFPYVTLKLEMKNLASHPSRNSNPVVSKESQVQVPTRRNPIC